MNHDEAVASNLAPEQHGCKKVQRPTEGERNKALGMDYRTTLRNCLSQSCRVRNTSFNDFCNARELVGFLIDTFRAGKDELVPRQIAANAMVALSTEEDGTYNHVVCTGIAQFMDDLYGKPPDDGAKQRLKDLLSLQRSNCKNSAEYLKWSSLWYPHEVLQK